jgi:hypothetical protein
VTSAFPDPDAAMEFLRFVEERHRIWEARQTGAPQPWTEDAVLAQRKFTNVFRLLDPGSQFVITDLYEDGLDPADYLFRCFLYRNTNLPRAWRALRAALGRYPVLVDLPRVREFWVNYSEGQGEQLFSGAYKIYPQSLVRGTNKVETIVDFVRFMFVDRELAGEFLVADSTEARFRVLRHNKGMGDFMSMQILTDFGYGTDFHENDFVAPGPGAINGAKLLGIPPGDALKWAWETLGEIPSPPVIFGSHRLSKMDVQNCLCEFYKYAKFVRKSHEKQPYLPANPGVPLPAKRPRHWTSRP